VNFFSLLVVDLKMSFSKCVKGEEIPSTPSSEVITKIDNLKERFQACMVLAGVGDAMGFKNMEWEFCKNGQVIHNELKQLGGIEKLDLKDWRVSDDTVMHIATAEALLMSNSLEEMFPNLAKKYVECFSDMDERSPGVNTTKMVSLLSNGTPCNEIPFNSFSGGCGAAMRAMCIGLYFAGESQRDHLISVAIESGRITHNMPIGFFGALGSAAFTAFAIEGLQPAEWGRKLLSLMPKAYEYLKEKKRDWNEYQKDLHYFENAIKQYLKDRDILEDGKMDPKFPEVYGVKERDAYYESISYSGWGGSSGHDSVIIAYDAFLGCNKDWTEFCKRGVLHGGDSDSTGTIGGALFGAVYGFQTVPPINYQNLEYRERLEKLATRIWDLQESRKRLQ